MKRHRGIAILSMIILAGVIWLGLGRNTEPVYQGKRLSQWLEEYNSDAAYLNPVWDFFDRPGPENRQKAREAIRQIGPAAVPFLLTWLQAKDSWVTGWTAALVRTIPWLPGRLQYMTPTAQPRRAMAYTGFVILGTNTASAAPALINILRSDTNNLQILCILGAMGKSNERILVQMFQQDRNRAVRRRAAFGLSRIQYPDKETVLALIDGLDSGGGRVPEAAAFALGTLNAEPEIVVPALVRSLEKRSVGVEAVVALGKFGNDAREALPLLKGLLNDPGSEVRYRAAQAIKRIDPEAAMTK